MTLTLAERAYFVLCLAAGRLLRSARYSKADIVRGRQQVRKRRLFYAPFLIWMSGPLLSLLDAGVRVLLQRGWEDRERRLYQSLYGTSIGIDADGTLVLPCLAGETLATLLEDPDLEDLVRTRAIDLAVVALADFHHRGLTHGDAMAENVLVDLAAGVARWFDFETVHTADRSMTWRRADDLRALVTTCLLRTSPDRLPATLDLILDVYADEDVIRILAASVASTLRRSLTIHLTQAALPFESFLQIARLLQDRGQRGDEARRQQREWDSRAAKKKKKKKK